MNNIIIALIFLILGLIFSILQIFYFPFGFFIGLIFFYLSIWYFAMWKFKNKIEFKQTDIARQVKYLWPTRRSAFT